MNLPQLKVEHIFKCINDKEPSFEVKMWITEGDLYRCLVNEAVKDIVSDDVSFQWEDMDGNVIIPNKSIGCEHIKLKRFEPVALIVLN